MSGQDKPNDGNLVPAGRRDLAPVAGANPLVARGIADLATMKRTLSPELQALVERSWAEVRAHFQRQQDHLNHVAGLLRQHLTYLDSLSRSRHPFDVQAQGQQQALQPPLALRLKELQHLPPGTPSQEQRSEEEKATFLTKPVAELDLSERDRMCIDRLGINTVGDLVSRTADELLEEKNFGMMCLNEVREKLSQYGLTLRGD